MKKFLKTFSLGILFSGLLVGSAVAGTVNQVEGKADADSTPGITLLSMIKSVHDNNLQTVTTNPLFDVSVKHGWLNAGGNPGCTDYTVKDSGDCYIGPDTDGDAYIDWGGARLIRGNDCSIVKIVAKKDIKLKGYATSTSGGDWANGNGVQTYKIGSGYKEDNWIGNEAKLFYIDLASTNLEDYSYETTLVAGEMFYWEFGAWENPKGNIDINLRGFGFEITENKVETLCYPNMVTEASKDASKPVEGKYVQYAIGHGPYLVEGVEEPVKMFETCSENQLGAATDNCNSSNWRITTGYDDGLIVVIVANEYMKVNVSRPFAGVGWTGGCNVVFSINGEIKKDTELGPEGDPTGDFYNFEGTLHIGDIFMFQLVFRWTDSRTLQMDGDHPNDSMPVFNFEVIPHTHAFSQVKGKDATCLEPGHLPYYVCDVCNVAAEDELGEKIIGGPIQLDDWLNEGGDGYIPLSGHAYGDPIYEWDEDTCFAYHVCGVCSQDEMIESVLAEFVTDTPATCETDAKGHYLAKFTKTGLVNQETRKNSVTQLGSALGHDYEGQKVTYQWANDFTSCTASISCKREGCEHVETETSTAIEYKVDTAATCETNEKGHFKATFTNTLFAPTETSLNSYEKPNSALGHDYQGQAVEYKWADDFKSCTAKVACKRQGCEHVESETSTNVEFVIDTPATCETNAKGHYKVVFANSVFGSNETAKNSVEKQGSALGHDYQGQTVTYTWSEDNKTCTATVSCKRQGCEHKETETVNVVEENGMYVANFTNPLFTRQTKEMPKKGCGGSVIAASTIVSTLALLGIGLVLGKKRKED